MPVDEHRVPQPDHVPVLELPALGPVPAGRIVWAVVCAAPDTIPSASPSATSSVPK